MRQSKLLVFLFLLVSSVVFSQIIPTGNWVAIGDTNLSIVTDDADNGDGVGDGAIYVNGQSAVVGQGIYHEFNGTMTLGEPITVETYTYNRNVSFVRFTVELFNVTDGSVLVSSPTITISNGSSPSVFTTLNYTALASDVGDVLQVRYIRNDNGNTARNFVIDNLKLNGTFVSISLAATCPFTVTPDLPLINSNASIEAEINTAVNRFSDAYLGTSAPSAGALASAESSYNALNINVTGGEITGDAITSFNTVSFLKTFAQHLKFNPGDANIQEKANNTVWLTSKYFCGGTLPLNSTMYSYQNFARPASLIPDFLDPSVKELFAYTLYEHSVQFEHFWEPTYDAAYQETNGAINTDLIYNISDAMLAYSLWQNTADERYRYMRGYKRLINRFFSHTVGTTDGIKSDGTAFHHWVSYNNYMYSYNTAASLLSYLSGTSFQVDQDNYKLFSEAFYAQYIHSNDTGVQALSTSGRNPQNRSRPLTQSALKTFAIAGGSILGLATADPNLAGLYNRIYGVDPAFNYSTIAPFEEGFFQFNHASASTFRKNNWAAFNKGFSNNMWGSEIYISQNRYGRYQSYGALEIIYPGNKETGNGYDVNTWDWNYNPGTTVIRLPWASLHAERGRIDELQQKRFVGTLNLNKKNSDLLVNNHGDYGLFSMDFQEQEGLGWGATHSSNNHNNTFTFKKSNFYFDDIIVCLGSGISNDDTSNSTITTLYQRLDNSGSSPIVNGNNQSSNGEVSFSGASDNWLLSNYNTGFYLLSGNNSLKVKKELQQNPNQNQVWPVDYSGNPTDTYYTGYIDHGTNPSNKSYEYILKPSSSVSEMQDLQTIIQGGNKPYVVHQQDANAHIVEHISKKIWGYAFFNSASSLSYDFITDVNSSCLVMTEFNNDDNTLLVSLSNPDLGFSNRSYTSSVTALKQLTLQGEWHLVTSNSSVSIVSANVTETIIDFLTVDGLSYEVLLEQGPETCSSSTTFLSSGWDNGFPNINKKAVFVEDYNTSSGNIDACSFEVKPGVKLLIESGDFIKVEGNIVVNGTLIVLQDGSVVQVDDNAFVTNGGYIEVQKETSTPFQGAGFSLVGSPMTVANRNIYEVDTDITWVRSHNTAAFVPHSGYTNDINNWADDNGNNWNEIAISDAVNPGEGYLVGGVGVAGNSIQTNYNQGTLNNGIITFTTLMNTNQNDSPNILSNPYASGIDIAAFLALNSNAGGAVYFWEHNLAPNNSFPGYNGNMNYSMQDISNTNGAGVSNPAASGGSGPGSIIPSGQGFGIKPTMAGPITFNNSMRSITNMGYRAVEKDELHLLIRNETYNLNGNTAIGFTNFTEDGLDNYDVKRLGTILSLYTMVEEMQLGIQMRSTFIVDQVIPLAFSTIVEENQIYTISIKEMNGGLIEQAEVYLKDYELNTLTNLSENDYSFMANAGDQQERFVILFTNEQLGSNDSSIEVISLYPNPTQNVLNIVSPLSIISKVEVFDVLGRVIASITVADKSTYQLDMSTYNTAMYFVKVTTNDGDITKRVVRK